MAKSQRERLLDRSNIRPNLIEGKIENNETGTGDLDQLGEGPTASLGHLRFASAADLLP
jgi:hypothetical protein